MPYKDVEKAREANRISYYKHKEKRLAACKKYYQDNREIILQEQKERYYSNPGHVQAINKKWEVAHKAERSAYHRRLRKENPSYAILSNFRSRLTQLVRGKHKSASTLELIGCSAEFLKEHIVAQFVDGMSWDNYGQWHVDHIKPCAAFDFTDVDQQKQCFNFTNLRPLWKRDNLSKGARY